jgi:hypothetical protein
MNSNSGFVSIVVDDDKTCSVKIFCRVTDQNETIKGLTPEQAVRVGQMIDLAYEDAIYHMRIRAQEAIKSLR